MSLFQPVASPVLQHPLVTLLLANLQVHKGDVLQGLQSNAVDFEPGKEPWRRFAAAAAAGTSSSNGIGTDVAEAAAVAAAAALGHRLLYVADQLFADNDAALANAIKAANNEFWREYRLVSAGPGLMLTRGMRLQLQA
jgi:hypothetical protein